MSAGRAYRGYMLVVLLLLLAFNYVDRLAVGLLLQDIKRDLNLSDTELGVMTGIAFAIFYSTMGIPIARLADRGNRVRIISVTAFLWGAAVAACGFVSSFAQMLAARVFVAVGEAGAVPPAHSLIADYYDRAERPRAVAIYMLGSPISVVIGYFLAGWLNEAYGWRTTFVILGAAGLPLALLAGLTLREPRRERVTDTMAPAAGSDFRGVCAYLWSRPTFRHLLLFSCIVNFFGLGIMQWQPAFFMRSYGLGTAELGLWLSLIYGAGGLLGTWLGGEFASRFGARNEPAQFAAMALLYSSFGAISALVYYVHNLPLAFALLGIATVGGSMAIGPLFANIQTLVPERMRATTLAIIFLFSNLIGIGLGPLAAGMISDALRPTLGDESLRWALLVLCPGYLWGGWHLWRARRTVLTDLAAADAA
jgi:MFS family permease